MKIEVMSASALNYYKEEADLETIEAWQNAIHEALSEVITDLKPFENKPAILTYEIDENELAALALFTAYTEEKKAAPKVLKNMWDEDKVFLKASNNVKSKYKQLLRSVDCYLPHDFDFNFEFADASDEAMIFGSVEELYRECQRLNKLTFNLEEKVSELKSDSVEDMAAHALTTLLVLAAHAISNKTFLWIN